jgi:NAD(P)-dependent dehydrogenase (short-subunit alcohol dehydrogenase family)
MARATSTLLMTGGSSGIGGAGALRLLREHPGQHLLLLMGGGRADRGAAEFAAEAGSDQVSAVPCDLASLSDIRTAAEDVIGLLVAGAIPPLHVYLGNAGAQTASATMTTVDGFEMTFGVNVLANYTLVRLLSPQLAPPARIVIVGSGVHFADFRHTLGAVPKPNWSSTEQLARPSTVSRADSAREGQRAYGASKLGVVYLVHALARRLPAGVDVYKYNPGRVTGTGFSRDASPAVRAVAGALVTALRVTPFAMGIDKAGQQLVQAAVGPRPDESGAYIDRGAVVVSSAASYDQAREDELWAVAGDLCGFPG